MLTLRTAILACLTAVTCVAMLLAYAHKFLRYDVVGNENGVFVLDRQTTLLHHCDKQNCTLITPKGTTIDSMRKLAGIPSPDEVVKKVSDQNTKSCNCQNISEQLFPKPKMQLTSFEKVEPEMPAMTPDMIKQNQEKSAKDLGMSSMMTPNQAPTNPFPQNSDNNSSAGGGDGRNSSSSSGSSSYPGGDSSSSSSAQSTPVSDSSSSSSSGSSSYPGGDSSSSSSAQSTPVSYPSSSSSSGSSSYPGGDSSSSSSAQSTPVSYPSSSDVSQNPTTTNT
ncbi:MAG: hypothetical protein KBD31_02160 [Proteobacteria bacterium]|nr:hypothetical protein [Pseudomonadota bacterium]